MCISVESYDVYIWDHYNLWTEILLLLPFQLGCFLFLFLSNWSDWNFQSVQFSSVTQSCLTLCNPMNCSTPGLPVHHQLLESTQTHVIELVMPSNYLILCHPLLLLPSIFPSIRVFSNESALRMRWPKFIGVSALASVLPMNTQDWSPLGWTGWISLQSKGLSRVFINTTFQYYSTILCSIEVAKVNILVLFWILQYNFQPSSTGYDATIEYNVGFPIWPLLYEIISFYS